ncbi:scopoletin glucosyltransferase-like [Quercus lobata]|uniref:Glycosyltransferase n=1 Tax=Quercus lobata TaxID=97700 RepID=A0A7N2MYF7_QUELO|nr:scopoletin glucosyltransferase-like [Quercus lobata]
MGSKSGQLHIFFFPFMAQGHMIPAIDMAKLFAARGVKATFVTTPLNMPVVSKTFEKTKARGINIDIKIIKFPAVEAGLPEGCENIDSLNSSDMIPTFVLATSMLQQPLEELIQEYQPSCIVADMLFPWAVDVAAKFGIPRLEFYGTSFFSMSAGHCIRQYEPHKKVSSDSETFVIPNFPGEIKLTRMQLPDFTRQEVETDFSKFLKEASKSVLRSYGVVVNSFYELEPDYIDHYRNVLGRKAWHIGPVSLCNKDTKDKALRGKEASIDEHECLKWLATKKPNSVVFICFGSTSKFSDSQLMEIAMGLEASRQQFIWVVRKGKNEKAEEDWLPKEFEKRMEGKGLIIRGWAPQILILDHEAVGGFVTHCGWNSTLEGVTAGVPMVTWPVAAEQFYNEKLVTQVLKIGVSVGAQQWIRMVGDGIKREAIQKAVRQIMVGKEAEEMRGEAKVLGEMARRAVEEGGSSYSDLNALIEELKSHCP